MSHILRIDASARHAGSTTRQLADKLVARLVEQGYGASVTVRDLAQTQLADTLQKLARARYDTLLAQLRLKAAAGTLGEDDVLAINALLVP